MPKEIVGIIVAVISIAVLIGSRMIRRKAASDAKRN